MLAPAKPDESRPLRVVYATYWHSSKDIWTFCKKLWFGFLNMAKSMVVKTWPWEKEFSCAAVLLREHAKANDPLLWRLGKFLKIFWYNSRDALKGLVWFMRGLFVDVPSHIANDYSATDAVRNKEGMVMSAEDITQKAEKQLKKIQAHEMEDLIKLLKTKFHTAINSDSAPAHHHLAHIDYHLTPGDQNDLLSSAGRGINEFIHFVSHNIFAKDPVAGAMYTRLIFQCNGNHCAQMLAAIEPYVKVSHAIGQAMGSSETSAACECGDASTACSGDLECGCSRTQKLDTQLGAEC